MFSLVAAEGARSTRSIKMEDVLQLNPAIVTTVLVGFKGRVLFFDGSRIKVTNAEKDEESNVNFGAVIFSALFDDSVS